MNKSLFWLTNNSTTKQEVELFNTSDQSGKSTTTIWNFALDWNGLFDGTNWFKSATLPPLIRFNYTKANGITGVQSSTSATLVNMTTAQLEAYFNANYSNFGTWSIIDVSGTNATFRCVLKDDATATDGIDLTTTTKGAVALNMSDDTPANLSSFASTIPANFYEGLRDNPKVEISSYTNFSYNEFLWSVIQRTYNVTEFSVWSANKNQLFQPFLFDRKTATGRTYQRVAAPIMDPYQYQNTVNTEYLEGYLLDGFTSLKYVIEPSAKLRLLMYYDYTDISTPLLLKRYGNVYKRLNLFMPSPAFVARQLPSQPGALKMMGENDFPLEEW